MKVVSALEGLILPLVSAFVNYQKKTGFESHLGHARKLPWTLGYAVIFTGYFNFLHFSQMTINEIPTSKPPSPFFMPIYQCFRRSFCGYENDLGRSQYTYVAKTVSLLKLDVEITLIFSFLHN